jgi:hypothetical protein
VGFGGTTWQRHRVFCPLSPVRKASGLGISKVFKQCQKSYSRKFPVKDSAQLTIKFLKHALQKRAL